MILYKKWKLKLRPRSKYYLLNIRTLVFCTGFHALSENVLKIFYLCLNICCPFAHFKISIYRLLSPCELSLIFALDKLLAQDFIIFVLAMAISNWIKLHFYSGSWWWCWLRGTYFARLQQERKSIGSILWIQSHGWPFWIYLSNGHDIDSFSSFCFCQAISRKISALFVHSFFKAEDWPKPLHLLYSSRELMGKAEYIMRCVTCILCRWIIFWKINGSHI